MTDDMMALSGLMEKSADADLLLEQDDEWASSAAATRPWKDVRSMMPARGKWHLAF